MTINIENTLIYAVI